MRTLRIELGDRGYPIHIGADLLDRADLLEPHVAGRPVLVVTNETVGPLYRGRLEAALSSAAGIAACVLPDGEVHKTLATVSAVLDALVERRMPRDCVIVALGGGVVGDIGGFAAATYQRGVDYIQVPTTLLSQVDSSVGGKTGVNHPGGKNLIGAFHQPVCVVSDSNTLSTLPAREVRAGFAEVVKYGLIRDAAFYCELEQSVDDLLALDPATVAHAVARSCEHKAEVVAADEREHNVRALLNLGHTFGHAIENGAGYGQWLHGEAVAAGTVLAADLSVRRGWLDPSERERIESLFHRANLPTRAPADLPIEAMRGLMAIDKKVRGGQLRLILLKAIGDAVLTTDFLMADLDETLRTCREAA